MTDRVSRLVGGAALVVLLAVSVLGPASALGAPRPGESCPDTTAAPGESLPVCGEGNGPEGNPGDTGAFDASALLPIVAAGGVGAALALVAAFLFFRRRAAVPVGAADPGEWWTCRNCGRNNVIGSPRCYACGEWQG
jgi:hypothetical protein